MDKQFENNYEILKQIINKLEVVSSNPHYAGLNKLVETLKIKVESFVIALHVSKTDYLKIKKSIKTNLAEIKKIITEQKNKKLIEEIKVLIEKLFECYDEMYSPKRNNFNSSI